MDENNQSAGVYDRARLLDALAHLRYRTHKYIATCPQCFAIEKILSDHGHTRDGPWDTLQT